MWSSRVFLSVVMMVLTLARVAFAATVRECNGTVSARITSAGPDISFTIDAELHLFRGRGRHGGCCSPNTARERARGAILECGEDAISDAVLNSDGLAEGGVIPLACSDESRIPEYNVTIIGCVMHKEVCKVLKRNLLSGANVEYFVASSGGDGCRSSKFFDELSFPVNCTPEEEDIFCKP